MTLIMSNEDIEEILTIQHCTEVLEAAFKDLAEGKAVNRPRSHTYTPVSNDNYYLGHEPGSLLGDEGVGPKYSQKVEQRELF